MKNQTKKFNVKKAIETVANLKVSIQAMSKQPLNDIKRETLNGFKIKLAELSAKLAKRKGAELVEVTTALIAETVENPTNDKHFAKNVKVYRAILKGAKDKARMDAEYNADVDSYKYFILDVAAARVVTGYEHKEDATEQLNESNELKGGFKLLTAAQLQKMGIDAEEVKTAFKNA